MPRLTTPTDVMLRRFGAAALRPAQRAAFEALAGDHDVLAILPTGGGKSLCYQLPAACGAAPTIVVSPLVALMKDQVDALQRRGFAAAQLSGAVSADDRARAWASLERGDLSLLYLAPEALTSATTLDRLARARPPLLAIDEAHCISEWGESFRPSYLRLGDVRQALGHPTTIALTATATPRTAREIVSRLRLREPVIVAGGFDRANLRLQVRRVAHEGERTALLGELATHAPGPAVFYAASRRDTERLAAGFARSGLRAAPFHAGLATTERATLQDRFQSNELAAIVATNAFGMGVDKPDVRLVVHAAPPLTLEAYYQEAGRGGRDGAPADCVMLLGPQDLPRARARIVSAQVNASLLRRVVQLLDPAPLAPRISGTEATALRLMATALGENVRNVAAAIRLLAEEGMLTSSDGQGVLRLLATPARLASDPSIPPADAQSLQQLLDDRRDAGANEWRLPLREMAALAPDRDTARFLDRLAAHQIAVWRPLEPPWRLARTPDGSAFDLLSRRHATRQGRNVWRHEQVARMVTMPRCRRLVLLRYFGDAAPSGPCGACDVCGIRD